MNFDFATPQRILFGKGTATQLPALAKSFGRTPFVVTGRTPARMGKRFGGLEKNAFPVSGEPEFGTVRRGAELARASGSDCVIAIGGGSVIDTAKAIAMLLANGGDPIDYAEVVGAGKPITRPSLPLIAVPTTAGAGSEATRNAVLRDRTHGVKVSLRSPLMLPAIAVVDPALTMDLPPSLTAHTGLDALSQLVEPFLSIRANPMTDALCREGLPRIMRSLERAFTNGNDEAARADMAFAALLGGIALANAGLGAVHGFAAAIGGMFDAPHGAICAALLAPVLEANAARMSTPEQQARLAELARLITGKPGASIGEAVETLRTLTARIEIPRLGTFGVEKCQSLEICERAAASSSMKGNPVPLPREALAGILAAAL